MSAGVWTVHMWSQASAVSTSLAAACERAGARFERHAEGDPVGPLEQPALLVAVLRAGERVIPPALVGLMEAQPAMGLLLLCEEALVRPTLVIARGQIVLLEPPLTPPRIEARLRLLMTEWCPADGAGALAAATAAPVEVPQRRYRARDYWFAICAQPERTASRTLSWRNDSRLGLTLASSEPAAWSANDDRWALLPDRTGDDGKVEAMLRAALGDDGALVQLSPGARQWRFFLPAEAWRLRVFSHQRLPRAWDAGRVLERSAGQFFRLAAAPGDVVCLTAADRALADAVAERSALDGGGPALFEELLGVCRASRGTTAGLVVEVT